jgi:hypothetical protein
MKTTTLLALSLLLVGCLPSRKEKPVSKEEAISFAKNIENDIKHKNGTSMDNSIDVAAFCDEIIKAGATEKKATLEAGIKEAWKKKSLSKEIISSMGDGGSYRFISQYQKDGHQHVLFRLYGNDGLNYHDYELIKYGNKVSAKDMFIYMTGENLSTTMAQLYKTAQEEASINTKSNINDYAKTINNLRKLFRQQEYKEAEKLYDNLPIALRNEKAVQILHLQITSKLDNDKYLAALDQYQQLFKNDPSSQLILLDGYFIKGQYEKALVVIDELDKMVQDPFLDYFRALLYTQQKDDKTAIAYLEKLYKNVPDFENGALELLANYVESGQYEEANKLVLAYKKNSNFNQNRLNDVKELYPANAENVRW